MADADMSTGKTVFVISIVLGCFAVLYPKIFYHMMFDEKKDFKVNRPGPEAFGHPAAAHGHPSMHMRNEQGRLFYGEEGRPLRRTIEKELKPGHPVPGMRPSMGGPGLQPPAPQRQSQGGGTMSILMPLYTTGIVIFFVYTVMKIMFKKKEEEKFNGYGSGSLSAKQRFEMTANDALRQANVIQQNLQRSPTATQQQPQTVETEATSATSNPTNKPAQPEQQPQPVLKSQNNQGLHKRKVAAKPAAIPEEDHRDEQIRILKERLAETEKAMHSIVSNMAALTKDLPQVAAAAAATTHPPPEEEKDAKREGKATSLNKKNATSLDDKVEDITKDTSDEEADDEQEESEQSKNNESEDNDQTTDDDQEEEESINPTEEAKKKVLDNCSSEVIDAC